MIGVILCGILSSCKPPTIKEPVKMYAISIKYQEAGVAFKNLNIRSKSKHVGEWTTDFIFLPLNEIPENIMCLSMEDWLVIVKPKLKEGAEYYDDYH